MFISTDQKLKIILHKNGLPNKLGANIASLETVETKCLKYKCDEWVHGTLTK